MAKQTLGQGDSNVVVRNQVVYGALPQDVIDRMGDTTLALQTTEQNVLPAINELKSNLSDLIEVITIPNVSTDSNGNYVTSYDWVDGKYIPGYSYQTPSAGTSRWFMTIRPSVGNKIVCHAFADDNSRINRNDVCFVLYKIKN